jgi:signal transduction histidine kinase
LRINLDLPSVLTSCLVAGTLSTFWLGYQATREWDRSTQRSVEARGNEILALLAVALDQDMKGGQLDVLLPFNQVVLSRSSLYDLADIFAGGFARFPYIESMYLWKASRQPDGEFFFFNRSERTPPWDHLSQASDSYPVVVRQDESLAHILLASLHDESDDAAPFILANTTLNGIQYQTVSHRIYADSGNARLAAVLGFTVNLSWVRQSYFHDLIQQIQRVSGDSTVRLEIHDEAGVLVAETGPPSSGGPTVGHDFPLAFSTRAVVSRFRLSKRLPLWQARVDVANDATLIAARRGTARTLGLLVVGVTATIGALLLTMRASRAAAALAIRQGDFVSAVSHEMKTPLSLITLAGDSLASGRCNSAESTREYGRLLAYEARQLSLLIDNVLCYARLIDEKESYSYESLDLTEIVAESVERFRLQFTAMGCDVQVESSSKLPDIRADRRMLRDALDNILDNAIKYGSSGGVIVIRLQASGRDMNVEVIDRGCGIAPEDLPIIFDKFQRGRGSEHKHRGSGLGLTIARQVIEAHNGSIRIESRLGHGTTVHITLPIESAQ